MLQQSQRNLYYFYVTCVILGLLPLTCGRTEWIDPHSMDEDPRIKCNCPSTSVATAGQQCSSLITSYYTRTINLILKSLRYHKEVYSGHFEIELVEEEYDFMNDFLKKALFNSQSQGQKDHQDWDKMDRLLTKMFANKQHTYLWEMMSWRDYLYTRAMSREFGVALGCIFLLWFIYKIKHTTFHLQRMVKYFMFILYIVDYAYTWIYMLKEKELEQLLKMTYTVPPECNVKNMGYYDYFKYLLGSDTVSSGCAEYHKIKDIDIFWTVSPSQVIGMQIGNMVLAPAEKIGNAFSMLLGGVLKNASWYMVIPTVLLIPILLFGLILGGCVLLSFVTNRGFSFNLLHLISFSFGAGDGGSGDRNRNRLPTINLTLPQIQIRTPARPALKQMDGEKKTSTGKDKMAAIEGEGKRQVEVEDVPGDSDENEVEVDAKSDVLVTADKCDVEDDYEVIA